MGAANSIFTEDEIMGTKKGGLVERSSTVSWRIMCVDVSMVMILEGGGLERGLFLHNDKYEQLARKELMEWIAVKIMYLIFAYWLCNVYDVFNYYHLLIKACLIIKCLIAIHLLSGLFMHTDTDRAHNSCLVDICGYISLCPSCAPSTSCILNSHIFLARGWSVHSGRVDCAIV